MKHALPNLLADSSSAMTMASSRKPSPGGHTKSPLPPAIGTEISRAALDAFVRRVQKHIGLEGQVSLLFADDATLRKLNREYRGQNKSTDVLSFPSIQIAGAPLLATGDLAVSLDTAARQASEHGHTLLIELKILLLHGLLHLAGFDHESDSGEMLQRETDLRAHFRLPTGLIERSMP